MLPREPVFTETRPRCRQTESLVAKSTARAMGSQIGRSIMRGVLGSIFGRR